MICHFPVIYSYQSNTCSVTGVLHNPVSALAVKVQISSLALSKKFAFDNAM